MCEQLCGTPTIHLPNYFHKLHTMQSYEVYPSELDSSDVIVDDGVETITTTSESVD